MPAPKEDGPQTLYRMYDAEDRLLYVGMTSRIESRIRQHGKVKSWWPSVATIRLEQYASRAEAAAAEAEAIRSEQPQFNIMLMPRPESGRKRQRVFVNESGGKSTVGVPNGPWEAFGAAVGNRNRSKWLRMFDSFLSRQGAPDLLRDVERIAELRGESVSAAVNGAVRLYIAKG